MYLSVELTDTVYTGNKDKSSHGYVHFIFSFAVLQDAISITRKDVHFAERVLYERSSMYFVLWSIHHIFKGYNYTVKSIARSLSNHKILPRQFCAVCRFFFHHSGVTWFKSTHRQLFPITLLSAFAPKGARNFYPENAKNRPQSGCDRHSEAGFLWFYSILGCFCPKSKKIA